MTKEETNWEEEVEEIFGNWAYLGSLGKMSSGGVRNGVRTSELKQFISKLISQEREKMIEKIRNFNPEYGELGAAIPDFKERLINLLQNK